MKKYCDPLTQKNSYIMDSANLKHTETICIIFNKSGSTVPSFCHFHQYRRQRTDLIIALWAKTNTLGHKILCSDPRQLAKSMQILESIETQIYL